MPLNGVRGLVKLSTRFAELPNADDGNRNVLAGDLTSFMMIKGLMMSSEEREKYGKLN